MLNKFEKKLLKNTIEHSKNLLSGEGSGHDWWHTLCLGCGTRNGIF